MPRGICSVPGCGMPHSSKGFCVTHYTKWRRTRSNAKKCSVSDCTLPAISKGFCHRHYELFRRNGYPGRKPWPSDLLRFQKLAEKNPMWKGDNVGINSVHQWVRSRKPKPALCERCFKKKPYDLANKSGKYRRSLDDWEWLCRGCHMRDDGRINNLKRGGSHLRGTKRAGGWKRPDVSARNRLGWIRRRK
jgi:hypothetical protein